MKLKSLFLLFPLLIPRAGLNPADAQRPLGKIELMALEATGVSDIRLAMFVQTRGIDFHVTDDYLEGMKTAGAESELIDALRSAKPVGETAHRAEAVSPQVQGASLEEEVVRNLAQAAKLQQDGSRLADAEREYRAAVQTDPQNPFLHFALGVLLSRMGEGDDALKEFREAIRLKPDFAEARLALGDGLRGLNQSIAEYREAVRIEPDNYSARVALAYALHEKGEKKEAKEQYRLANELPASGGIPGRIWKGVEVERAKRLSGSKPKYPREAKKAGIQGTVRLQAIIGRDGAVKAVKVLAGDPELVQAALQAVWRWRYQPTLLNGSPVEVVTEVDVNFRLSP